MMENNDDHRLCCNGTGLNWTKVTVLISFSFSKGRKERGQ